MSAVLELDEIQCLVGCEYLVSQLENGSPVLENALDFSSSHVAVLVPPILCLSTADSCGVFGHRPEEPFGLEAFVFIEVGCSFSLPQVRSPLEHCFVAHRLQLLVLREACVHAVEVEGVVVAWAAAADGVAHLVLASLCVF